MTSSLCLRPAIPAPRLIAGHLIAQCASCGQCSPPDQVEPWSADHRATAREVNDDIDAPGATPVGLRGDPWPDVTALVAEVNGRAKPEPVEGPPF